MNELNGILTQLEETAKSMQADLGRTHIEKWKADAATKRQTLAIVESIQRNLQSALPETIAQLKNSPEDVGMSFKLYRNLVVLYDNFGSVVENAGAFGSKDEFQSLGNDMSGLENARHVFGERLQKLAASKEEELTRLRTQVKTLSAAPPPPAKKVVVDDTEPPPKKTAKKKVTKPETARDQYRYSAEVLRRRNEQNHWVTALSGHKLLMAPVYARGSPLRCLTAEVA